MIRERQAMVDKVERRDLLSGLLEANDHDLDLETMTEDQIISMFLILHLLSMLTVADSRCPRQYLYLPFCWT